MQVSMKVDYIVEIPDSNTETTTACFKNVLLFLRDFVMTIVNEFAIQYMAQETQPFACTKRGSKSGFSWETKYAKDKKTATIFGTIIPGQMQVKCSIKKYKKSENTFTELFMVLAVSNEVLSVERCSNEKNTRVHFKIRVLKT